MKQYLDLCQDILDNGEFKPNNRTGVGTISVFGRQCRFNLQKEFPLVNSKFTAWKLAYHELLWYLKGTEDISYLQENGVKIWNEWVKPGTTQLGPVYGVQWRKWKQFQIKSETQATQIYGNKIKTHSQYVTEIKEIDQVQKLIDTIKTNPTDRRMIVSAWNPAELDEMQLPPCHMTWQCNVVNGKLNMHLLQRSVDTFLGLPWNWCNYAMLAHMIAHLTDLQVGEFVWTGVDVHLYDNQIEATKEMLSRPPIPNCAKLNILNSVKNIDDFKFDDLSIENYVYHPAIKIPVVV